MGHKKSSISQLSLHEMLPYNIKLPINEPIRFESLSIINRTLIILFILFSISIFLIRVPNRTLSFSQDFKIIYVASKTWVTGQNPYDNLILQNVWVASGEPIETAVPTSSISVYPITTLIVISPLTYFKWNVAKFIWFGLNIILFLCLSYRLMKMTSYIWPDTHLLLIIPAFLSLTFIQQSFVQGQPVIIVIALIVYSIHFLKNNNYFLSALTLSISLCLKPQLSFLFFIYYFVNREFKVITICIILCAGILFLPFIRMGFSDFSWVSSYLDAIQWSVQEGHTNDPSMANPGRHTLINMQYFLLNIIKAKNIVNLIVYAIWLIELLLVLKLRKNSGYPFDVLLDISAIAIISLLPMYHRNYDASLLLIVVTFCFEALRTTYAIYGKIILIMMTIFVIPGPSILKYLESHYNFIKNVSHLWFWEIIIVPHHAIMIFILSIILIYIMFKRKNREISYISLEEQAFSPLRFRPPGSGGL